MDYVIRGIDAAIETMDNLELAIDIETSSLTWWTGNVAVISLADRQGRVAVLHVRGDIPLRLKDFINGAGTLIGHNAVNFDGPWLAYHGMPEILNKNWYDTLVAEMVISATDRHQLSRALADVLPRRLGRKAQKMASPDHARWMAEILDREQVEYCAADIKWLIPLMDAQRKIAAEHGQDSRALELEMDVVPAVMTMVLNGLRFDQDRLENALFFYQDQRDRVEDDIAAFTGRRVNMRSPQQVKALLAEAGIKVDSTKFEVMKELEMVEDNLSPLASMILEYRKADQPLKLYPMEKMRPRMDYGGFVHANYWQCGADTGRFTSFQPNMQQVPRDMRDVVVAPPGHVLVSADYSQIEVRLGAAMANDTAMLDALTHEDIHTAVASGMFGVPPQEVTKEQRNFAKACSFTLMFAGGANTLYQYSHLSGGTMTLEEAKTFINKFFARYTGLWRARQNAAYQSRSPYPITITLHSGLRRVLTLSENKTPQTLLNTQIQGNAAAGLKYALRRLRSTEVYKYLSATVHDEIVAVVPEAEARRCVFELVSTMHTGMKEISASTPIRVEGFISSDWGKRDAEKVTIYDDKDGTKYIDSLGTREVAA